MDQLIDVALKDRPLPGLRTLGIAAQHFSCYRNLEEIHHRPDLDLLSLIIKGECRHLIGTESFSEHGPCLGITPRGGNHCIITGEDGIEIMNLYLDPDRLTLPLLPAPFQEITALLFPPGQRFHHRLNRVIRVDLTPSDSLLPVAFGLLRELEEQRPGFETAVMDYLRLFLLETCRCAMIGGVKPSAPEPSAGMVRINQVRQWLDVRYREQVTLEELAAMAGCTRNYLCRAFKTYTGKTVIEYLLERRIQAAMVRLRSGNDKVIDIAFDCGFNELSYFNRIFKRLSGSSPSVYRRQRLNQSNRQD